MKHINEFGQIESEMLKSLLWRLEGQVQKFLEDEQLSPLECQLIAKHLSTSVSFAATASSIKSMFSIK